jgi:hypothetical protein
LQCFELLLRPVRVGRQDADQFRFVEAGHPAKSGIDEGDASFEVDGAHAGNQRLRHGVAESVGGAELFLGFGAMLGMAPQLDQRRAGDQGENDNQDSQAPLPR